MLRSLIKTLRRFSTFPSASRNLSGEKKVERTRTLLRAAVAATGFAYFCTETCPYSGEFNATFAILIWIIPRKEKGVSSAWTCWPRRSCQGRPVLETTIIIFYLNVSFPDPLVEWAVLSILSDCRAVLKMAGSPSPFAGQATEQLAAEAIASLLVETKRNLLPRWIVSLSIHCLVKVMLG